MGENHPQKDLYTKNYLLINWGLHTVKTIPVANRFSVDESSAKLVIIAVCPKPKPLVG